MTGIATGLLPPQWCLVREGKREGETDVDAEKRERRKRREEENEPPGREGNVAGERTWRVGPTVPPPERTDAVVLQIL